MYASKSHIREALSIRGLRSLLRTGSATLGHHLGYPMLSIFAQNFRSSSRSRILPSMYLRPRLRCSLQRSLAEPGCPLVVESFKSSLRHMSCSSPDSPQSSHQERSTLAWDPEMIALRYVLPLHHTCPLGTHSLPSKTALVHGRVPASPSDKVA